MSVLSFLANLQNRVLTRNLAPDDIPQILFEFNSFAESTFWIPSPTCVNFNVLYYLPDKDASLVIMEKILSFVKKHVAIICSQSPSPHAILTDTLVRHEMLEVYIKMFHAKPINGVHQMSILATNMFELLKILLPSSNRCKLDRVCFAVLISALSCIRAPCKYAIIAANTLSGLAVSFETSFPMNQLIEFLRSNKTFRGLMIPQSNETLENLIDRQRSFENRLALLGCDDLAVNIVSRLDEMTARDFADLVERRSDILDNYIIRLAPRNVKVYAVVVLREIRRCHASLCLRIIESKTLKRARETQTALIKVRELGTAERTEFLKSWNQLKARHRDAVLLKLVHPEFEFYALEQFPDGAAEIQNHQISKISTQQLTVILLDLITAPPTSRGLAVCQELLFHHLANSRFCDTLAFDFIEECLCKYTGSIGFRSLTNVLHMRELDRSFPLLCKAWVKHSSPTTFMRVALSLGVVNKMTGLDRNTGDAVRHLVITVLELIPSEIELVPPRDHERMMTIFSKVISSLAGLLIRSPLDAELSLAIIEIYSRYLHIIKAERPAALPRCFKLFTDLVTDVARSPIVNSMVVKELRRILERNMEVLECRLLWEHAYQGLANQERMEMLKL